MRSIYVIGPASNYANWIEGKLVNDIEDADLVVFTGGEDVDPQFYDENAHPFTKFNTHRDMDEIVEFKKAVALNKHIIGICRGSQFLCVMNGGRLVQHQNNPEYVHPIKMFDGTTIEITSTHHQAQFPFEMDKDDYKILGWTENMLPFHQDGSKQEMHPEKECEIVYYPKHMCLGIQGHPESMAKNHPTISYLRNLLNKFMKNDI